MSSLVHTAFSELRPVEGGPLGLVAALRAAAAVAAARPGQPVGRVYDLDGQILLLRVEHSESTTMHLAETLAGVLYSISHPCVVADGGATRVELIPESDHCCARFRLADDWLRARGLQAEGPVGAGHARRFRARDVVGVVTEQLAQRPLLFLWAPAAGCDECDLSRASVPTG